MLFQWADFPGISKTLGLFFITSGHMKIAEISAHKRSVNSQCYIRVISTVKIIILFRSTFHALLQFEFKF